MEQTLSRIIDMILFAFDIVDEPKTSNILLFDKNSSIKSNNDLITKSLNILTFVSYVYNKKQIKNVLDNKIGLLF